MTAAAGAVGREAHEVVRAQLEVLGALSSLDLLECDCDGPALNRYYRLAPRVVPLLVHGVLRGPLASIGDMRVLDCICEVMSESAEAVAAVGRGERLYSTTFSRCSTFEEAKATIPVVCDTHCMPDVASFSHAGRHDD
jgi:hypothetical protein